MSDRSYSNAVRAISGWYDCHPEYVLEILDKYVPQADQDAVSVHDFLDAHRDSRMQLEYAFSTNVRGRALVAFLKERGLIETVPQAGAGKRYLDIGCAYGGFLKEFSVSGYSVHGVEFDRDLARICIRHMEAIGVPVSVVQGDFLDDALLNEQDAFDFITCNDVIEHVHDAQKCLNKIYRLLKPGGAAYIETVNRRSLPNNVADIHFGIFGLNLLNHGMAERLYMQLTGSPSYQVAEFYPLSWYVNAVRKITGAEVEVVHVDEPFDHVSDLKDAFVRYEQWERAQGSAIDPYLRNEVRLAFYDYLSGYFSECRTACADNDMERFHRAFSDRLIRFVVRKPG